jgi:hypothetical protein
MYAQYEGFAAGDPNAVCLKGAQLGSLTFPQYVQQCLKGNDLASVETNFSYLESKFIDSYEKLKAQYDDLIITNNNVKNLSQRSGIDTVNQSIQSLTKKKNQLEEELKRYKSEAEAKNQSFLDSILQGRPQETLAPTLQDATLMLFWFGWILLGATLIFVRWLSPGGTWRSALFATVLLLLATLSIYAVLQKVA